MNLQFIRILIVLFLSSTSALATENSIYWIAEKPGSQLYILGSIHQASPDFYPLNALIYQHFDQADALVLEAADLESPQTISLINELSSLPAGKSLKNILSAQTLSRAETFSNELGIPFTAFQYKKPWYFTMVASSLKMMQLGYMPHLGIDMHFLERSKQQKMPLLGLETSEYQLRMLDSLNMGEQDIIDALDELKGATKLFTDLAEAWKKGDLETITALSEESLDSNAQFKFKLLTQRNIDWVERLNDFSDQYDRLFVVVGAAHLSGNQGLLTLLREDGYRLRNPL